MYVKFSLKFTSIIFVNDAIYQEDHGVSRFDDKEYRDG